MNFTIVHEVPGRIRVSVGGKIPESHACAMEERLLALPAVNTCVAYPKADRLQLRLIELRKIAKQLLMNLRHSIL